MFAADIQSILVTCSVFRIDIHSLLRTDKVSLGYGFVILHKMTHAFIIQFNESGLTLT